MSDNKRELKRSMLVIAASVASLVAVAGVSVTWGDTTNSGTQSTASSNQTTTSNDTTPPSTPPTTTRPVNPQDVATAKRELSSYISSVQSLIASDPVLSQTDAGKQVDTQQKSMNNMSDGALEAFYTYTQSRPDWKNWVDQERALLQNVDKLEKASGITAGSNSKTDTGTTSTTLNTSNAVQNQATSATNTLTQATPSQTVHNTSSLTVTAVSPSSDSLTVTINQTMASADSTQGAAQTVSDPTVINFSNVPSSPTPQDAFNAQLAADLMGMGANIAQSMAGDAPSELTVVIAGEGTSAPDPARIVAEAVAVGLYGGQEALAETANHMNKEMADNNNIQGNDLTTLETNIYNNVLTALGNIGTVNNNILSVNHNVQTLNSNVNVVDQHVQTLSYRDIERDLADGVSLVSLCLPVKDGGYLDDVEGFVQTLLHQVSSAGYSVSREQKFFDEGKSDMTNGNYQQAYQDFVQVYHGLQEETKHTDVH